MCEFDLATWLGEYFDPDVDSDAQHFADTSCEDEHTS